MANALIFPQRRDVDLLAWSGRFHASIAAQPEVFGLTHDQAVVFGELQSEFAAGHALTCNPTTNSTANIAAKNFARQRMLYGTGGAWELVNIIQAFPGTDNAMRSELGLRVADEPSQVGRPRSAPTMSIMMMRGRRVTVRLRDRDHPDRRGKPEGVVGATVLYWCGEDASEQPPSSASQWNFAMNASRPVFEVEVPVHVPVGAKLWLTCFWFNRKMQGGPLAQPAYTRVSEGVASLRLAA